MKSVEQWQVELEELIEQRKQITRRIEVVRKNIRNGNKIIPIAFQMFGKKLKDMTLEEKRAYQNARQQIYREKNKQMTVKQIKEKYADHTLIACFTKEYEYLYVFDADNKCVAAFEENYEQPGTYHADDYGVKMTKEELIEPYHKEKWMVKIIK